MMMHDNMIATMTMADGNTGIQTSVGNAAVAVAVAVASPQAGNLAERPPPMPVSEEPRIRTVDKPLISCWCICHTSNIPNILLKWDPPCLIYFCLMYYVVHSFLHPLLPILNPPRNFLEIASKLLRTSSKLPRNSSSFSTYSYPYLNLITPTHCP